MVQDRHLALLNWPNAISLSRVLLVSPTVYGLLNDLPLITLISFAAIVASDFIDGALARKLNLANGYGTFIDHGADATVVIALCSLFAFLGIGNWVLPMIIAVAFIQYAFDSQHRELGGPRPSNLGRANGIAFFVFVALCSTLLHLEKFLSMEIILSVRSALAICGWLLVISSALSIWQRWRF